MKATQVLHDSGQSIWLDNITRDLLDSVTLKHYINELSVTGLTSGGAASGRGGRVIREVLEGSDGGDLIQGRGIDCLR